MAHKNSSARAAGSKNEAVTNGQVGGALRASRKGKF